MNYDDDRIKEAVSHTQILRPPQQTIATFGITRIHYYLLTEPAYSGLFGEEEAEKEQETIVREGLVVAQQPRIVTPYYLSQLDGFSPEATRYFDMMVEKLGHNAPGLFYAYKNEPSGLNIISEKLPTVVENINTDIEKRSERLTTIIKGEDALWDVSLLRFIYELTRHSVQDNIMQLGNRGLLGVDNFGVPMDARHRIEDLFAQVALGEHSPSELKDELERWGLFAEYQDRFFNLVRKRKI